MESHSLDLFAKIYKNARVLVKGSGTFFDNGFLSKVPNETWNYIQYLTLRLGRQQVYIRGVRWMYPDPNVSRHGKSQKINPISRGYLWVFSSPRIPRCTPIKYHGYTYVGGTSNCPLRIVIQKVLETLQHSHYSYEPGSINSLVLGDGNNPTFNDGNPYFMGPYKPLRNWVEFPIPYYMEIKWELSLDPIAHMCLMRNAILIALRLGKLEILMLYPYIPYING